MRTIVCPPCGGSEPAPVCSKHRSGAASATLQWLSRSRLVFGYSLLAVARGETR